MTKHGVCGAGLAHRLAEIPLRKDLPARLESQHLQGRRKPELPKLEEFGGLLGEPDLVDVRSPGGATV